MRTNNNKNEKWKINNNNKNEKWKQSIIKIKNINEKL